MFFRRMLLQLVVLSSRGDIGEVIVQLISIQGRDSLMNGGS